MRALIHELRIWLAEWLLYRSLSAMPKDARECVPLAQALDGYIAEANRINRWGQFRA